MLSSLLLAVVAVYESRRRVMICDKLEGVHNKAKHVVDNPNDSEPP